MGSAWTETTAFHFHCSDDLGAQLKLAAGDDAQAVRWLNVDRCAHKGGCHTLVAMPMPMPVAM